MEVTICNIVVTLKLIMCVSKMSLNVSTTKNEYLKILQSLLEYRAPDKRHPDWIPGGDSIF